MKPSRIGCNSGKDTKSQPENRRVREFSMKEITGELWDFYGKPGYVVCITTNGTVRKDGACVMGRGCAREAAERNPALPYVIGDHIKRNGNTGFLITTTGRSPGLTYTFPVKHNWWEQADLELIRHSAQWL